MKGPRRPVAGSKAARIAAVSDLLDLATPENLSAVADALTRLGVTREELERGADW
jgi:hypothetical protein